MQIYLDLTIINYLITLFVSYTFSFIVLNLNFKDALKRIYLIIPLIISFLLNVFYIPYIYMFVSVILIIVHLNHKKDMSKIYFYQLIFFLINNGFLLLIGGSIYVDGILFINRFITLIFTLFYPIATIVIYLFSIHLFKLIKEKRFVIPCIVNIGNKKIIKKGFYDSGNNLLYKSLPVIFINEKKPEFSGETLQINTINGSKLYQAYNGMITIKRKNYKVYVVFLSFDKKFASCSILLNSNLL